jgi:hypothetical protein
MTLDSKSITHALLILGGLFLGLITAVSMATSVQGGLAALTPLITIILTIIAIVKPRLGLYCLVPLVIWVDQYKRLAVYFGGVDSMIVIQTLAMPFIILAALNVGYILNILFGRIKLEPIAIVFYGIAFLVGCGVFFTMDAALTERAQRAANIGGYLTLIPITHAYLRTFDEWRKFFAMQVIWALPAAAWAIKQYYYGFDDIEWTYARSGLSRVHYSQMFGILEPRVFGFFGSASALGCAAIYCAFSWWHCLRYREKRFFWAFSGIVLLWVLVCSTQRTALFYPALVLIASFVFRTKFRICTAYAAAFMIFILAVINSDYLLNQGLEKINNAISPKEGWGSQVLRVSTFSDRIRGWQRLKRPETYSLFGTGKEQKAVNLGIDVNASDYNHDVINKILINVGVVGFAAILIPGIGLLVMLHRTAYQHVSRQSRNDAAFALALALPVIGLSFIGGDNFNTNPINMQIWTSFVGVLILRSEFMRNRVELKEKSAAPNQAPLLSAT